MDLVVVFFYLFAALAIGSAAMVITVRNPVHAVLFLIMTFFAAAGLFVLLGAEFLAMLLVIVYVGAVAVLFLFVVMMLDVDFAALKAGVIKNAGLGLGVAGVMLAILVSVLGLGVFDAQRPGLPASPIPAPESGITNTEALGRVLYTKYVFFFQAAGIILLIAMIGAIVLTLRQKEGVKRQSISAQNARRPETAVQVLNVQPGEAMIPSSQDERR
ncbi:MAG: NADH-quinone oxidoreductase subunit J [Hyphomicrobiaceae bacterium]